VTTVHPGGIKTNIARNMTTVDGVDKDEFAKTFDKKLAGTSPEKAAKIILDGVRKNRARVLVGPDAKALDLIVRVTGSGYQRLFSSVMSRALPDMH
jgi:short-subunit dehydrogenase